MPEPFDQFWAAYPRKTGKGKARAEFAKAITRTTLDAILTALEWQRTQPDWVKNGGQFIPHPSTWLHQERWDDEPMESTQLKERTVRNLSAVQAWAKRSA
jgi:hypothetical protein